MHLDAPPAFYLDNALVAFLLASPHHEPNRDCVARNFRRMVLRRSGM